MREVRRPVLLAEIGKPCSYCGSPMDCPTRDHIHPRRLGGTLDGDNRTFTCDPCNNDKADMSLEDWLAELRAAGDPRAPIVAAFMQSLVPIRVPIFGETRGESKVQGGTEKSA